MEKYYISAVGLIVTIVINVAIIAWKFSGLSSKVQNLENKDKHVTIFILIFLSLSTILRIKYIK